MMLGLNAILAGEDPEEDNEYSDEQSIEVRKVMPTSHSSFLLLDWNSTLAKGSKLLCLQTAFDNSHRLSTKPPVPSCAASKAKRFASRLRKIKRETFCSSSTSKMRILTNFTSKLNQVKLISPEPKIKIHSESKQFAISLRTAPRRWR